MNHRSPRLVVPLVLAVLFLRVAARAAPSSALPLSYHGVAHGYRVGLPADWVQVSDADLMAGFRAARRAGAPKTIEFDSAFKPARGRRPIEFPHVIVCVLPYSSLGLNRQVNEDEFPDVVRRMTGTNLRLSQAQSLKSDARLDTPVLERGRRRYWMTGEMTVAGQGRVRSLFAGYLGRDAVVQVCFYGRAVDWDRHAATGRRICESLTFDPEKGYPVAAVAANPPAANERPANGAPANPPATHPPAASPTPRGNSDESFVGMKMVIGAIAGAAVGLVGHAIRRRPGKPDDEIDPAMNRPRPW